MNGPSIAVGSILIVVILWTEAALAKSTKACPPFALDVPGENVRKSRDPLRVTLKDISALKKKSSVEESSDCSETSPAADTAADTSTESIGSGVDEQKEKIKALQTKIHKNLLKLFHRIKQKKLQEAGDRKDLGSLDDPGKAANIVSDKVISLPFVAGVLKELNKTKSQDSKPAEQETSDNSTTAENDRAKSKDDLTALKNAPSTEGSPSSPSLKALDKVVSHILQNSSEAEQQKAKLQDALKVANETGHKENDAKEDESEAIKDPYAAIAAGPDHPKLPPALKAPRNDDSVVPDLPHRRPKGSSEDEPLEPPPEAPEAPEAPNQLPGAGMGGDVNPDLSDPSTMQQMRMEALQDQMQDSMRAQAMEGINGMRSMSRMNGMPDEMMGGMRRIGGFNGMQGSDMMEGMGRMNGMGGDVMEGMGRIVGMNGGMEGEGMMERMGGMGGMNGMIGMPGMGGMRGMGGMAGYNDMLYGRDDMPDDRYSPYGMDGMGEDEPELPPRMIDERAVGRNHVPMGYDERMKMPFSRYFFRPEMDDEGYADDEEDDDEEDDDGDDVDDDREPENDMDDGYMGDYERKTKIAKIADPRPGIRQRNPAKTSKKTKTKGVAKSVESKRRSPGISRSELKESEAVTVGAPKLAQKKE